ncbi:hypothetical protein BKA62DRAFT_405308 [Auriculariales sp. MPI-PUGE-AT-0066]|nr:hypothetical protein BKA62DRAFT_405308 [Auriculariales sp. MPI-PUGE-AT-0066]
MQANERILIIRLTESSANEVDTVYTQSTNEILGSVEEGSTNFSAASPEHMNASPDHKREQKRKLTAQERREAKVTKELAEIMAIPEPPKGATNAYKCFVQHCYQSSAIAGKFGFVQNDVATLWKALSTTERQRFTKEASDINKLRAVEHDKWAEAVGYTNILKINRERVRSGKQKLRIPASVRPVRKTPVLSIFVKAKFASGEFSYSEGFAPAMKRAGELWRELTPSQKVYEAQSDSDYQQRLAARSKA